MLLSDFRTRVARVSGMSTTDSGDLALIDAWVNEAIEQFLRDTKINVQLASLAVTAGSADYHLDDEILAFQDAWFEPNSGERKPLLEPTASGEIIRMREFAEPTGFSTMYYAIDGWNLLQLYPAPQSSSDVLHIKYVPRPSASLTAAGHSPSASTMGNIPNEFHTLLEAYAKWKACEAEEHKASDNGLRFQAEYERGVSKVKSDLNKKAGVMRGKARVGRRFRFPAPTPGTDTGVV